MTKVFVSNLAWKTSWQDLKDHFKSFNLEPIHADVFKDSEGRSRGMGIVELSSEREAEEAIQKINESELNGRNITVREDKGSTGGRGSGGFGGRSGGDYQSRGFGRRGDGEGRGFGRRGDGEGRGFGRRGDGEGRGFGRRGDGEGRGFYRRD